MAEQVALVWLEYGDGRRVPPGESLPRDFPQDDVAELRKHGSIGSEADFEKLSAAAAAEDEERGLRAQAEAAGFKLVRSSDKGASTDKRT